MRGNNIGAGVAGDNIIIKPSPNANKTFLNATQYMDKLDPATGQPIRTNNPTDPYADYFNGGAFKGERFPRTTQGFRPDWSTTANKWLTGFETDTQEGIDKLNDIARKMKLRVVDGPRKGELITEADVYDFYDPFFNHPALLTRMTQGELVLSRTAPKDIFTHQAMRAAREFEPAGKGNKGISMAVRYTISDKETDTKIEKKRINLTIESYAALKEMTFKRKLAIAGSLGIRVDEKTDKDIVETQLFNFITENKVNEQGITAQELFLDLAQEKAESLELKYQISLGIKNSIIRKSNKAYYVGGQKISDNLQGLYDYYQDPINSEALTKLLSIIEEKSK